MATRLKTIYFTGIAQAVTTSNLTALADIPVYIPETVVSFKSVKLTLTFSDRATTATSIGEKTLSVGLNGGTKTTITNTNTLANSGENISAMFCQDFTSVFTSDWTGTNGLVNINILISHGSTGYNQTTELEITYEYDDTSATQIKTIFLPMNALTGPLPTSSGGPMYTIPALTSYLPESNIVIRDIYLVTNFNTHGGTSTTDPTLSVNVGAQFAAITFESALATNNLMTRHIKLNTYLNTPTMHSETYAIDWYTNTSAFNHMQHYVVVTYEFHEPSTTRVFNSLMLPMDIDSPITSLSASEHHRATRDIWIQEPGVISTEDVAFFVFFAQTASATGLNMRINGGTFVQYTDNLSVIAGMNCAMCDSSGVFELTRGKNTLTFDIYCTGTIPLTNSSGFWLLNYISDKASQGIGAHNHTVSLANSFTSTTPVENTAILTNVSFQIPESDYFISAAGTLSMFQGSGTLAQVGFTVQIERLIAEGGTAWEVAYKDISQSDNEAGYYFNYSQMRTMFKRFPGDDFTDRMDIETPRRWRYFAPLGASTAGSGWGSLNTVVTYHSISYDVEGELDGFTGPITNNMWRPLSAEKLKTQVISGNGSYNFKWYDNTQPVFITAADATKKLKTKSMLAGEPFNIGVSSGGGGSSGPTYYAR